MALDTWKQGFALVFAKQKYMLLFAALFAVLLPAYAVLTNIAITSPPSFNPYIKPVEAGMIFAISVLAALGFTLAAFQFFELHSVSRKSVGGSVLGAGAGGTVLATFASACSVCQPIWLFWLGIGSATAFLADYGAYMLLASIALLLYSIRTGLLGITRGCRMVRRERK